MARRVLLSQRVGEELAERARTGEPEPGIYFCGRCMRSEGVQMFTVRVPSQNPRRPDGFDGKLICPCCSFPDCPHRGAVAVPA